MIFIFFSQPRIYVIVAWSHRSGAHRHRWVDAEFLDLKITTVSSLVFKDGASIQMEVFKI